MVFTGARNSCFFQMIEHLQRSGEGTGDYLFFCINDIVHRSERSLQVVERTVGKSVTGDTAYLFHVLLPESGESEIPVSTQIVRTTVEKVFRVFKPLKGRTGGDKFRIFGKCECFGISGKEGYALIEQVFTAGLHVVADIIQEKLFRLQGMIEQPGVIACAATKFYHFPQRSRREILL